MHTKKNALPLYRNHLNENKMGTSGNYMVDSLSIDKNFNVSDFADKEREELIVFFYEKVLQKTYSNKTENLMFNAFLANARFTGKGKSKVKTSLQDDTNAKALQFNLNVLHNLFSRLAMFNYEIEEGVINNEMFCEDLSLFANLFASVYKDFYSFVEFEYHLDYQIQMDISVAECNTMATIISEHLFWNERDTQYFCQELKANFHVK